MQRLTVRINPRIEKTVVIPSAKGFKSPVLARTKERTTKGGEERKAKETNNSTEGQD